MASVINGSFASPLANAHFTSVSEGGLLSKVYNGVSGLSVFVTFLMILVAYDQCELFMLAVNLESSIAKCMCSHVYLEQGFHRRAYMENAVRWTFPVIGEPEDGRI